MTLIVCGALSLLLPSVMSADESKGTELDGTWEIQKSMEDGGKWGDETAAKFVVVRKDGVQTITKDGQPFSKRRFTIDATAKTKSLNFDDVEDAEKKSGRTLGIYELDGATLKVAIASDPKKRSTDRPKDFKEDGSTWQYVYKRVKK